MVAINFSADFAGKVSRGEKCQTIRQTKRGKVGNNCQLYTGQRTKFCRRLRKDEPPLLHVTPIMIRPEGFVVGDTYLVLRNKNAFARADGFKDYAAMVAWFKARYGSSTFHGYLHIWARKGWDKK